MASRQVLWNISLMCWKRCILCMASEWDEDGEEDGVEGVLVCVHAFLLFPDVML